MRTKRCCAVSIAASACGLQPDARHLDAASMDSCFGSELKLADAPEQTICEPDFVPGQPHLQDKFCKTCCLQGFAVNSSCIRVLSSHARSAYKNSTREGFWNSTHACPPFRVVNQHMRCVGPVLILFTEDPGASEDWSPLPEGMVTDGGVVWFRVAYGTLIPLVRREKGSGDSRARGVLADADLSCTGAAASAFSASSASSTSSPPSACDLCSGSWSGSGSCSCAGSRSGSSSPSASMMGTSESPLSDAAEREFLGSMETALLDAFGLEDCLLERLEGAEIGGEIEIDHEISSMIGRRDDKGEAGGLAALAGMPSHASHEDGLPTCKVGLGKRLRKDELHGGGSIEVVGLGGEAEGGGGGAPHRGACTGEQGGDQRSAHRGSALLALHAELQAEQHEGEQHEGEQHEGEQQGEQVGPLPSLELGARFDDNPTRPASHGKGSWLPTSSEGPPPSSLQACSGVCFTEPLPSSGTPQHAAAVPICWGVALEVGHPSPLGLPAHTPSATAIPLAPGNPGSGFGCYLNDPTCAPPIHARGGTLPQKALAHLPDHLPPQTAVTACNPPVEPLQQGEFAQLSRPCTACRHAKILCDRAAPVCGRCARLGIACVPPPTVKRGRPSKAEKKVRLTEAAALAVVSATDAIRSVARCDEATASTQASTQRGVKVARPASNPAAPMYPAQLLMSPHVHPIGPPVRSQNARPADFPSSTMALSPPTSPPDASLNETGGTRFKDCEEGECRRGGSASPPLTDGAPYPKVVTDASPYPKVALRERRLFVGNFLLLAFFMLVVFCSHTLGHVSSSAHTLGGESSSLRTPLGVYSYDPAQPFLAGGHNATVGGSAAGAASAEPLGDVLLGALHTAASGLAQLVSSVVSSDSLKLHAAPLSAFVLTSIFFPDEPPQWFMPYVHAIGAAMIAGRLHSTAQRYRHLGALAESPLALNIRRAALIASVLGAVARALVASLSRGRLFWHSCRLLAVYNAVVLLAVVCALWTAERPATYPPADTKLTESLALVCSLIFQACAFTPRNRRRLAAAVRGIEQNCLETFA